MSTIHIFEFPADGFLGDFKWYFIMQVTGWWSAGWFNPETETTERHSIVMKVLLVATRALNDRMDQYRKGCLKPKACTISWQSIWE
jgi:hypothetical protein